jgi:hypothetical protein
MSEKTVSSKGNESNDDGKIISYRNLAEDYGRKPVVLS